jgi:two-component system sensor histidine kinase KdpD
MSSMRPFSSSLVLVMRYLLTIGLIVLTTVFLFVLREALNTPLIALLYLLPVGLTTALWGLMPGIMSAFFAFLSFNYFFIQPYYTLSVHHTSDVFVLLVFLVVSVVISQLVGRARQGLAAATAREREATQLYELSIALTGLHEAQTIARILAEHAQAMFQAERIELSITDVQAFTFTLPPKTPPLSRQPELVVPLQAARGAMGEIHLWRATPPISLSEKRLVQTFASQGALSLERTWLAQAETRAKVLEESDRLKSALLSSVSHELRTPLATIKAAVTSLRGGEVDWDTEARSDLLAAVDDETDHLNLLVGNLLDMSRIESGTLKPQRQWNILSEIIGGVLARMQRFTGQHQLKVDVPEDLPLMPLDYVQMEQVFTNLISNSVKYAPVNTLIHIRACVQGGLTVHVQVSNQGPPVPAEHLERIFDKFYRVTATDRVTGTGLGLSICKGIIEAHGGHIWAENLPSGFEFNFTLPLTWDGAPPPQLPIDSETI